MVMGGSSKIRWIWLLYNLVSTFIFFYSSLSLIVMQSGFRWNLLVFTFLVEYAVYLHEE